ncbi:hypothetical protein ACFX1Q_008782 [Malus domestica]
MGLFVWTSHFPNSESEDTINTSDQHDSLLRYQLIRVNARGLGENCKWLEMFEDVGMVIFCVSLSDYDQFSADENGYFNNKMLLARTFFESIVNHPTFEQMDFLLILNKFDLFEDKVEWVPLNQCEWFEDFRPVMSRHRSSSNTSSNNINSSPSLGHLGAHYIAAKFKRLYSSLTGKKLYVSVVKGLQPDSVAATPAQHTDVGNIAYADDGQSETSTSSVLHTTESREMSEASVMVQGSYGTKIEAVTRRILWIKSTDPEAKVLVFSSWHDVLDVLEHAFTANDITHVRMKGGRKSQVAISEFKGEKISAKGNHKIRGQKEQRSFQVLLLLIQHGANGLNLLETKHVILVEPLLNPSVAAQAISWVHRIGQKSRTIAHLLLSLISPYGAGMDLYTFPVEGLLQSVTSLAASEIGLFPGFKKELTELRQSSLEIQQYLGDVAHQPRDRSIAVRIWVKDLKDVAHDADDVVEDINYEVLRRTVEIQNHMKKKEEMLVKSRNIVILAWTLVALCCGSHASHILHSLGIHAAHGSFWELLQLHALKEN